MAAALARADNCTMLKAVIGGVVVLAIALVVLFVWSSHYRAVNDAQADQIAALNDQLSKLEQENADLKSEVAKVQAEENSLAAQNDDMRKAIASVRATGKLPQIPAYPPK